MRIFAELADKGLSGCSQVVQIQSQKGAISGHFKAAIAVLARVWGYEVAALRIQLARSGRMRLAYTTCTVMSGRCAVIGLENTPVAYRLIHRGRQVARFVSSGVAPGTPFRGSAVRLIASGSLLSPGVMTSDFVLSSWPIRGFVEQNLVVCYIHHTLAILENHLD